MWLDNLQHYLYILFTLLVIVDPLAAIPLFIHYTDGQTRQEQRQIAKVCAAAVGTVLITSIFLGDPLLRFFGISLSSFRVGAGICILLMAIAMLNARLGGARATPEEKLEAEDKDSVAVVPLAIPILAGPGAISSMIVYSHSLHHWWELAVLTGIALLIAGSVAITLFLAEPIARRVGKTGINIATRILGLILMAVAVEFMATGLRDLFPVLQ
ncbi:MAG: NAAT family transporter [Gammaproteobacteria bacterium]|nr:MAG: NAAT family transporter [Gammaproteobacteria bacterium]